MKKRTISALIYLCVCASLSADVYDWRGWRPEVHSEIFLHPASPSYETGSLLEPGASWCVYTGGEQALCILGSLPPQCGTYIAMHVTWRSRFKSRSLSVQQAHYPLSHLFGSPTDIICLSESDLLYFTVHPFSRQWRTVFPVVEQYSTVNPHHIFFISSSVDGQRS